MSHTLTDPSAPALASSQSSGKNVKAVTEPVPVVDAHLDLGLDLDLDAAGGRSVAKVAVVVLAVVVVVVDRGCCVLEPARRVARGHWAWGYPGVCAKGTVAAGSHPVVEGTTPARSPPPRLLLPLPPISGVRTSHSAITLSRPPDAKISSHRGLMARHLTLPRCPVPRPKHTPRVVSHWRMVVSADAVSNRRSPCDHCKSKTASSWARHNAAQFDRVDVRRRRRRGGGGGGGGGGGAGAGAGGVDMVPAVIVVVVVAVDRRDPSTAPSAGGPAVVRGWGWGFVFVLVLV